MGSYDFEHWCDEMPDSVHGICKLNFSSTSQMSIQEYEKGVCSMKTTFYGFKYCPYCGEKLGESNNE